MTALLLALAVLLLALLVLALRTRPLDPQLPKTWKGDDHEA